MAVSLGYSSSMFLLIFFVTTYFLHLASSQTCTPPTDSTVAFFNGSAYARVNTTFDIKGTSFRFRTCVGGTILQQTGANGDSFTLTADVLLEKLNISWNSGGVGRFKEVDAVLNSGEVSLLFEESMGSIILKVNNESEVLATIGEDDELFTLDLQGSFLEIGNGFTGCVNDNYGTSAFGLELCRAYEHQNVLWDQCQLDNIDSCDPCIEETPCQNNGACSSTLDVYVCQCTARYSGDNCEEDNGALCNRTGTDFAKNCSNNGQCVEDPTGNFTMCNCITGYEGTLCENETDYCASNPCTNGGTCVSFFGGYNCTCPIGYESAQCETNINDCISNQCQNGGTCFDGIANYTCNCPTGYDGALCEVKVDLCQSSPCQNRGQCVDIGTEYDCICVRGYTGLNCELDLEECSSSPCQNNATCNEYFDFYNCTCQEGFEGEVCEVVVGVCKNDSCEPSFECQVNGSSIECVCPVGSENVTGICEDIDECLSDPCQNNGVCQDLVDMYTCNCTGTGFEGDKCESNIDDCRTTPCVNGGNCTDGVNNYNCTCHPGYEGDNCDVDINECSSSPCQNGGTCLENSDSANYEDNSEYKSYYPGGFDYANAEGFKCACQPGYTGNLCDIDIDECSGNPCQNGGSCTDGVNSFTCDCLQGWSGTTCTVEIKCDTTPCQNGATCVDNIPSGGYRCTCPERFGGDRCEVELSGCLGVTCSNEGTCVPQYDESEQHSFVCECISGFRGVNCEIPTLLSFLASHNGLTDGTTFKEELLDYTLSFRTTIPSSLLLFAGATGDFFRLELLNGGLKLTVRDGREDVTVSAVLGEGLNDGEWHKVDVMMNETSVLLSVSTGPPSSNGVETWMDGVCQVLIELVEPYLLGTMKIGVPDANVEGDIFIGCMRDITNHRNSRFFDQATVTATSELLHGCNREEQCDNSTCAGNGACTDLWWEFSCDCNSGFTGPNCTDKFVVGTFSFENSTSYATFDSSGATLSPFENTVRLQFRTRQANGTLFLAQNGTDFVSIYLINGQLKAEMSLASTPVDVAVGSALNDGIFHTLYFSRQGTNVSLMVDATEDSTEISNSFETFFGSIFVGGIDDFSLIPSSLPDVGYFKGCLWDMKYNQYSLQFFPLTIPTEIESLPMVLENVLDNECASDDLCQQMPCENGGTCYNEGLWNEFQCDCPYGYTGSTCESETICGPTRNPCPGKVACIEKADSYECVVEATFAEASRLRYEHNISLSSPLETISFRMRSRRNYGLIFHAATSGPSGYFVAIDVTHSVLTVRFNLGSAEELDTTFEVDDGTWHNVSINFTDNSVSVHLDGMTKDLSGVQLDTDLRGALMAPYAIFVGGVNLHTGNEFANVIGFSGCLEEVRIGDHLLPFFNQTVYSPNLDEQFFIVEGEVPLGCSGADVCSDNDCQNGLCVDEWNEYSCNCTSGYEGRLCDMEIDECDSDPCVNGGTCQNQLDDYMCLCLPGYSGKNCEENIDECNSAPCDNGGTCKDLIDDFECQCPTNFTGRLCEFMVQITCDEDVCENNSTCIPRDNAPVGEDAFTCSCQPGYTGSRCSYPINYCDNVTCENGGTCSSDMALETHNCSCVLGFKGLFCEINIPDCSPGICQNGGTCQDLINDFECDCVPGFTGDVCQENINDCSPNPCYAGTCVDGVNDFTCNCPNGYEGNLCDTDIDECVRFIPCQNGATCIDLEGGYTCTCPPNVFGSDCQFNPCLSNSCVNGVCTAQNATHYLCNCSEGYRGSTCSAADCSLVTSCQNGGSCQEDMDQSTWTCLCPEYIEGDVCQFRGPCSELECQNGANCSQTLIGDKFEGGCDCLQGYNGSLCENEIDWCASGPCMNEGNCSNTLPGPVCTCNPGYGGEFCENKLPDCASGLCQNGAICRDFDFSYECNCTSGFSGKDCEINIDDCPDNVCENGECVDGVNNYTCDCTGTGFEGFYCGEDIDECDSNPCLNGGTCQNLENEFKCECVAPYLPPTCSTMAPCSSNPCTNGGSCFIKNDTAPDQFVCDCRDNYQGLTCEEFVGENTSDTPWGLIGGVIGGVILLILLILLIILFLNIRNQRATAGTYSPSRQEISGSRVEMDNVLKLPPPERLI